MKGISPVGGEVGKSGCARQIQSIGALRLSNASEAVEVVRGIERGERRLSHG